MFERTKGDSTASYVSQTSRSTASNNLPIDGHRIAAIGINGIGSFGLSKPQNFVANGRQSEFVDRMADCLSYLLLPFRHGRYFIALLDLLESGSHGSFQLYL